MFNLTKLEHTLSLSLKEAVKGELESLFFDKVIANLGLCISVYDIESIYGGFIFANESAPTYTVIYEALTGHRVSWKKANLQNDRFLNGIKSSKHDDLPCILLVNELDILAEQIPWIFSLGVSS
ncbi:DNA-directed RNA polymerase III subunit RPC8 [Tanacetum coccineum]